MSPREPTVLVPPPAQAGRRSSHRMTTVLSSSLRGRCAISHASANATSPFGTSRLAYAEPIRVLFAYLVTVAHACWLPDRTDTSEAILARLTFFASLTAVPWFVMLSGA